MLDNQLLRFYFKRCQAYRLHMPNSFPSTRWTLLQRVRLGSAEESRAALDSLCRAYWYPLYSVARKKQLNEHDAQDTVQGFFESLLRRDTFAKADASLGKLRQLLLTAFDNYCGQQSERVNRQKRGGGIQYIEFNEIADSEQAEQRYLKSGAATCSIEALYNRAWAHSVMERSLQALRDEYTKRGWQARYDLLVGPLLQKEGDAALVSIAATAGTTAGALRVSLHRMRGHYRDKIERELASTIDSDDPKLIREEMAELFNAFT